MAQVEAQLLQFVRAQVVVVKEEVVPRRTGSTLMRDK
jgi:hypothetical protein